MSDLPELRLNDLLKLASFEKHCEKVTPQARVRQLMLNAIAEQDSQRFRILLSEIRHLLTEEGRELRIKSNVITLTQVSSDLRFDTFDIFSDTADRGAIWIEAVVGIDLTRQRMREIASASPGDYFIFNQRTGVIVEKFYTIDLEAPNDETGQQDRWDMDAW